MLQNHRCYHGDLPPQRARPTFQNRGSSNIEFLDGTHPNFAFASQFQFSQDAFDNLRATEFPRTARRQANSSVALFRLSTVKGEPGL